jgi:hypothetical protein
MAKAKAADASGLNKTQKVEAAMTALGDPGPKEIQEYVKKEFGDELPYSQAATYKSIIKKRRGLSGGKRGGGPSGPVDLKDVMAVKELYDRLGEAKLNEILKLFK